MRRIEKVLRRTSPSLEDLVAREPVVPGSRCGLLEDAEHLEAAALGKDGELGDLPFTGLIGGGEPGIDGRTPSQLNPLGSTAGNWLIFLVRELSKSD